MIQLLNKSSTFVVLAALLQHITVLIGICYKGRAVAGVIHQPYFGENHSGRTIWGIVGLGAFGVEISKRKFNTYFNTGVSETLLNSFTVDQVVSFTLCLSQSLKKLSVQENELMN